MLRYIQLIPFADYVHSEYILFVFRVDYMHSHYSPGIIPGGINLWTCAIHVFAGRESPLLPLSRGHAIRPWTFRKGCLLGLPAYRLMDDIFFGDISIREVSRRRGLE